MKPAAESKVVRWVITMWMKTKNNLKRFGIGYIVIGCVSAISSILVLLKDVSFLRVGGLILSVWFIVYGSLMVSGKGFKFEE